MNPSPARPNSGPTASTSWMPAGPTTATILELEMNCWVTVVSWAGCSWVSPWASETLVPLAALSCEIASSAKCNCSAPSIATGPVIGPSKPTETAHLPPELPPAAAVELALALALLLLLLPQPAATSAISASAAIEIRNFIGMASSSGDPFRLSTRLRTLAGNLGRRPIRVIGGGRRSRRAEHRHHAHRLGAGVLQAVHGSGGELDAAAGRHRGVHGVGVQNALAVEHVDHLVVEVEVVGRARGRDVADEMRRRAQPGLRVGKNPELPLARRSLRRLIAQPADARARRAV